MPHSDPLWHRVLDRTTRPPVLTIFASLQCCILVILSTAQLSSRLDLPTHGEGNQPIGDFAAFFTGATLVHQGLGDSLYQFSSQKAAQEEILGRESTGWQPYLNPPGFALLLSPTVSLGYARSFVVFTVAQVLVLLASTLFLLSATYYLRSSRWSAATCILLALGFPPLSLTALGGQNTPLSFALMAGVYSAIRLNHRALGGVLLGLLTFKPQYALALGVIFLFRKEVRLLVFAALIGLVHYGLGAMVSGVDWPLTYLRAISIHRPFEIAANLPWHFSLSMVAEQVFSRKVGRLVFILGGAAFFWISLRAGRQLDRECDRYPAWFGLAVCTALLVSPHLQFYEAGILALPAILGIETIMGIQGVPTLKTRLLLLSGYYAFFAWRWSPELGIQPLFFLLLTVWAWMAFLSFPVERE